MLKITVEEKPETTRIKVEGRLAGPYVQELDRTWRSILPALSTKTLSVDLSGMTGVDEAGKQLLAEIYGASHAQFIARSVLTEFYAEQARERSRRSSLQGGKTCEPRTFVN